MFAAVPLAACTSATPVADLGAECVVTSFDDGRVFTEARLNDLSAQGHLYELGPGESLHASLRNQEKELAPSTLYQYHPYVASFVLDHPLEADEQIVVTYRAASGDLLATFRGTAPQPFTVSPPVGARNAEPVTVTWTPIAGEKMRWRGETCIAFADEGPIPVDTGSLTFPPGVLSPVDDQGDCMVSLAFLRTRQSQPKTEFRYAFVSVEQAVPISFTVAR